MNKRTIDADELHKLTALLITSKDNEHIAWSKVLDAAFPLAEQPDATHGLVPLPESEWPEWFDCYGGKRADRRMYGPMSNGNYLVWVHCAESDGFPDWAVRTAHGDVVHSANNGGWAESPAAALEAAGLPVGLLEGLKRPTPAHESPRVVAAAVDMVKEIGQHKAKAAKDREEWLAPFPGWVREWCADDDKIVPLRYGDTWLLYADAGTVKWGRKDWFGLHYRDASPGKQFVGRLIDFAGDLNLPLYADGNVPLWGDVIDSVHDLYDLPPNPAAVIRIDGDTVFCGDGSSDSMSDLRLLRRHQAIADLPGIRNDSSAGKPDSNDSVGGVIVPPKPDKSTVVADNVGNSVGKPKVKLRVGILVEHEEMGRGVIAEPVTEIVNRVHVRFFDSGRVEWLPKSDLTPIPPPLIDNGDGTWTVDGYGMFRISFVTPENEYYWHSIEDVPWADGFTQSKELFPTKDAAALDLFERMEGVR